MNKLKTLKDLQKNTLHPDGSKIRAELIKQEAIKWVKSKGVMREITFQDWINFFNITEKDLK